MKFNGPQVTVDPACPECRSMLTVVCKTQKFYTQYQGETHRAQRQIRKCQECGSNFPIVRIRERAETNKRRRVTGSWE